MKYGRQVSAGGVLFRPANGGFEVALIRPRGSSALALPKGLVDGGEDPQAAALREVREETGMRGEPVAPLGYIRYYYYSKAEDTRYFKLVHFFLMRHAGGSEQDHDREVEEVVWMPAEQALRRLSYKGEREVLERALGILRGMGDARAGAGGGDGG